jgi:hypothetical protein
VKRAIEDRILGGEYVDAHFPTPIAAIMDAEGNYKCAATFITRRHLVTAGHCFNSLFSKAYVNQPTSKPEEAPAPYLLVGDVCIRKTNERCVETNAQRREIDFVIYDAESGIDLAIIQLRKDQVYGSSGKQSSSQVRRSLSLSGPPLKLGIGITGQGNMAGLQTLPCTGLQGRAGQPCPDL